MKEGFAKAMLVSAAALLLLGVFGPSDMPKDAGRSANIAPPDPIAATAWVEQSEPSMDDKHMGLERLLILLDPPMIGTDIWEIQVGLRLLGYDPGYLDGIYGSRSQAAVKAFQRDHGLPATGTVDQRTLEAMALAFEETLPVNRIDKPKGEISIVIDVGELQLIVFADGEPYASFPIAAGSPSTPTPFGNFEVTEIKRWSGGFGSRWIGLNVPWGDFGIHGTDKPWTIGTRASSGCIRMYNKDVALLSEWVKVGTTVSIVGAPSRRLLFQDDKGSDVKAVQERLANLGYLTEDDVDGFFGPKTREAVIRFQRDSNIRPDGNVGPETYKALGI